MSYFLTRTLPDDTLIALASKGELSKPEVRKRELERLLKSTNFERMISDFTDAWLNLREMDFTAPDKELFPEYDQYLRYSMPLETRAFFKELINKNLPVKNIVDSNFVMVNGRLAQLYGIPNVSGSEIRKVSLPNGINRGGFLTQASILKVSANGTNTSPVVRGVWVMERILGQTPSPPPPGVPGVEPDIRGATTLREKLDKHREVDSCNSCHSKFDPLGFALEEFNPIGGQRDFYRSLNRKAPKVKTVVRGRGVRYHKGPNV